MQATQQKANQNNLLEKVFKLSEHGTNVKTEIIAGITTFMTMAYILAVNSNMLAEAGMDAGAVFVATALSATISCFVMAFLSNYPIALAPGMGLNAFFAYTVVLQMGYTWQMALLGVFIEGVLFIILTVTSLREQIINCIPKDLKNAVTAGVGLFIASVGMTNAGIINTANGTLALSSLHDPLVVLSVVGLVIAGILVCRNVRGALLLSILLTSAIGMLTGIVTLPTKIVSLNVPSLAPTFMQAFSVPLEKIFSLDMVIVVFTFLFMDFFDTAGTLVAVGSKVGLLKKDGSIENGSKALLADSVATCIGSIFGTTNTTSYVESLSGASVGAKTGFSSVVVGGLFLVSLFFSPLLTVITSAVTAPALIIVGSLMCSSLKEIEWERSEIAIPSFLTILLMPLTYSIGEGIACGFLTYVILMIFKGKAKKVHPVMYVLSLLFIVYFAIR